MFIYTNIAAYLSSFISLSLSLSLSVYLSFLILIRLLHEGAVDLTDYHSFVAETLQIE